MLIWDCLERFRELEIGAAGVVFVRGVDLRDHDIDEAVVETAILIITAFILPLTILFDHNGTSSHLRWNAHVALDGWATLSSLMVLVLEPHRLLFGLKSSGDLVTIEEGGVWSGRLLATALMLLQLSRQSQLLSLYEFLLHIVASFSINLPVSSPFVI